VSPHQRIQLLQPQIPELLRRQPQLDASE
jgi:hypothetical protein